MRKTDSGRSELAEREPNHVYGDTRISYINKKHIDFFAAIYFLFSEAVIELARSCEAIECGEGLKFACVNKLRLENP